MGSLEFLLSDGGHLREPRVFFLGSQASFQVLRGILGFLRRCCKRKGPHLALTGESPGFSRVAVGGLRFLLKAIADMLIDVRIIDLLNWGRIQSGARDEV